MNYIHITEKDPTINHSEKLSDEANSFHMVFHEKLSGKKKDKKNKDKKNKDQESKKPTVELKLSSDTVKKSRNGQDMETNIKIKDYEEIDNNIPHKIDIKV